MKNIFSLLFCILFSNNIYCQWVHIDPPTALNSYYIDFIDDQVGYLELETGDKWRTINSGQQWTQFFSNKAFSNFIFFSMDTGIAVIDSGLGKTFDGGSTWNTVWYKPSFFDSTMIPSQLYFSADHQVGIMFYYNWYPLGSDSIYFYKSIDAGNSWNLLSRVFNSMPGSVIPGGLTFIDSLTGFFSLESLMYKTNDGGLNWSIWHTFQNPVQCFHAFSSDTLLAVELWSSAILKTVDNGQNWQNCISPVNSVLYSVHFISSDVGYICGGNGISSGYVIKTTNGGAQWSLDYNDVHTYSCMSFPSPHSIFIGGEGGAVIKYIEPSDTARICLVTVDTNSQHNVIIWDKTQVSNVDSFIVYREITTNNYKVIASIPYDSMSAFVDTVQTQYFPNTGDPNSGTYRYKLQMHHTGGGYSLLGPYHNTIFIGNNNGTFIWPQLYTIENSANPVNSYVLMRDDSSNGNWHQVTSVSGTQQTVTDPQYSNYQNIASWRIQTQWNLQCTPIQPYNLSISNLSRLSSINVPENNVENLLSVFPNPTHGNLTIDYKYNISSLKLFDVRSKLLYSEINIDRRNKININVAGFDKGMYFLIVESDKGVLVKRVVVD